MTFQPGHKLSPGRRHGSRNKLGREFDEAFEESKARGYTHPYLRMMELANDPNVSEERRDAFLKECASYACPKAGTIQHQFVSEVPRLTTVEDAENFIASFVNEFAPELSAVELTTMVRHWIESKRAGLELEHKLNPPEQRPQIIQVIGGLPTAPGMEGVLMPGDQRAATNGHTPQLESSGKESSTNGSGGANAPPETPAQET